MTRATKAANQAIDIAALDTIAASDKGAEIELTHPTSNKPLGLFVTILGKDSQIFREYVRDKVNARLRDQASADRRNKPLPPKTAEQADAEAVEALTLCTLGWRSQVRGPGGKLVEGSESPAWTIAGEELTFSVANAMRVYTDFLWIREQVDNAIGDLENFMPA